MTRRLASENRALALLRIRKCELEKKKKAPLSGPLTVAAVRETWALHAKECLIVRKKETLGGMYRAS